MVSAIEVTSAKEPPIMIDKIRQAIIAMNRQKAHRI